MTASPLPVPTVKEIQISGRRFEVHDWAERPEPGGRIHPCGNTIVSTFKVTLPRMVGVGAVAELIGDERHSGIVEDVDPRHVDGFVVRGSVVTGRPARV